MLKTVKQIGLVLLLTACAGQGCLLRESQPQFGPDLPHMESLVGETLYPDVSSVSTGAQTAPPPRTILDAAATPDWWDMSLEEAMQIALSRSTVMRDLGANVMQAGSNVRTIHEPALASSDPYNGMEAALAAFDTAFTTGLFAEKNDRMMNNFFTAGGARIFDQNLGTFQSDLTKRSAAGTITSLRSNLVYDANNAAGNRFPRAWDSIIEGEVRQPLLQGGGIAFNQIAGPDVVFDGRRQPSNMYHGVMIARVNTDVSLADFRIGLRNLASNVENAYWDLYFAYRDLDAKVEARNGALEAWRTVQAMLEAKQPGGVAEREAQFREQYYRCEDDVREALTGRLLDRTNTSNGSSGGTFRAASGVHVAERRLRLMIGLEINDGRLIRPSDEPKLSPIVYDWRALITEGLAKREELHRQRLQVRRRELELVASRNFLLPRLDVVGRYRYRGLGENLFGGTAIEPTDPPDFGNGSLTNLFGGNYQEWQMGVEMSLPIGFRRAHAAVQNAQLQLARERAILDEQERTVLYDLSNAVADVYRAYESCQTNFNCRLAAKTQVDILREKLANRLPLNLDQLVDAERRFADADIQYQQAVIEYMLAMKNVHFEKGTLLEYNHVYLAENPEAEGRVGAGRPSRPAPDSDLLDYAMDSPPQVSRDESPTNATVPPAENQTGATAPTAPQPLPSPAAELPKREGWTPAADPQYSEFPTSG